MLLKSKAIVTREKQLHSNDCLCFSAKEIKPGASGPYISKKIKKIVKREHLDLPLTQSSELSRPSMGSSAHSPSSHSKPIINKHTSSHGGTLVTRSSLVRTQTLML